MKLGFIGLGDMGKRMSVHLLDDFQLGVYNRTKNKANELVSKGATWFDNPEQLAMWADMIFVMVSDREANLAIFTGEAGLCSEKTSNRDGIKIINMSTLNSETSIELSKVIQNHNPSWKYLEAPVSGTLPHAENKELIIFTGGEEDFALETSTILERFGRKVEYIGELGKASKLKLLVNTILATQVAILAETFHLAEAQGLSSKLLYDILNDSALGNVISKAKGKNIIENQYPTLFNYKYIIKDLDYAKSEFSKDQTTTMLDTTRKVYKNGIEVLESTDLDSDYIDFSAIGAAYKEK